MTSVSQTWASEKQQTERHGLLSTGMRVGVMTFAIIPHAVNVTSAGWQVTLCDPMWHVSSRRGVATLRTAIHLLLVTYWL